MSEKSTSELENALKNTHVDDFGEFCQENRDSMMGEADSFPVFIKEKIKGKGLTQQLTFLKADIPERYGYKLLSGEKKTKQRDVILRICYAAELTLEETQLALRKYEMAELYAKAPRDALIMIMFNERPGSIIDVNELLINHHMAPLRTSGAQD